MTINTSDDVLAIDNTERPRRFLAAPVFQDEEKTRAAYLLNFVTLLYLGLIAVGAPAALLLAGAEATRETLVQSSIRVVPLLVPILLAQFLLRRGYVRAASILFTSILWLAFTGLMFFNGGVESTTFPSYMSIILMFGLLIGGRAAFSVMGVSIVMGGIALYLENQGRLPAPVTTPNPTVTWVTISVVMIIVGGLLFLFLRNLDDMIRRVRAANIELRKSGELLEQRVADATRDLALAAEVGQRISLLRNPEEMLAAAVELIRERFDLYYTQIYLTDPTGRNLVLRAGTGEAGRTLLQQRHSLPVDLASINGTVASEQRPIIVVDTETSLIHRANPLLPETRSELAVPLIAGERVVGVLDLQSSQPFALSEEVLPAFEALAGQLAVAIVNADLYVQVESARQEIEMQAQRMTRQGWDDFLDGVDRPDRIGFQYEGEDLQPLSDTSTDELDENALRREISIVGEGVGTIKIEGDTQWSNDQIELVDNVAQQVARQVESLRLLAQSQQYQQEAEEALRRLTREGWQTFQESGDLSFIHTDKQVRPMTAAPDDLDSMLTFDLEVRGEPIGMLGIPGDVALPEDDQTLIANIQERLSQHIENLRLNEQTQVALAQTDELYGISQALNEVETASDMLEALARSAVEEGAISAILMYLDLDSAGNPEWTEIVADWRLEGQAPIPVGTRFYLPEMPLSKLWIGDPDNPLLISDVTTDERVDDVARGVMMQGGSQALVIIPLTRGGERIGLVIFNWDREHDFSQHEEDIYRAIIGLASPAVQSRRLLEQTQRKAESESLVNIIGQRIQSTTSVEDALQVAIKELGQALGVKRTSVQIGMPHKSEVS
jgi:GAF domain-containing protein